LFYQWCVHQPSPQQYLHQILRLPFPPLSNKLSVLK
jgi:hypothetical protein